MIIDRREVSVPHSIFRSYDIRGIVGSSLTTDGMVLIGKAIGSILREAQGEQIAIGYDGRHSSPMLAEALSQGLMSTGCDVIHFGMIPTPLLYYAAQDLPSKSGIMITGSHNPADYNGLKIVLNGCTIYEDQIQAIYQRIQQGNFVAGYGMQQERKVISRYINHVASDINVERPIKVIIDAGNGVAGLIAPQLFKSLGCDVTPLYCEVDGDFPNHHPDPSDAHNLAALISAVRDQHADIGLAFDGDGDRLGVVTNAGNIIHPDRVLMLYAQYLIKANPGAHIIFDVKCSAALTPLITGWGGKATMWKTGHSLIKAKMTEVQAQLAGEMSGHFFFKDRWYGFDDALYAGARLLEILAQETADAETIFASFPTSFTTPELRVAVPDNEKFSLMAELIAKADFPSATETLALDGLRVHFPEGWGLVRPSNTTPYLILRFEAETETALAEIKQLFKRWLLTIKSSLVIPF